MAGVQQRKEGRCNKKQARGKCKNRGRKGTEVSRGRERSSAGSAGLSTVRAGPGALFRNSFPPPLPGDDR